MSNLETYIATRFPGECQNLYLIIQLHLYNFEAGICRVHLVNEAGLRRIQSQKGH